MQINQIKQHLNLDHITVIEKVKIICFPKKLDKSFLKKFNDFKKQLKQPNVELVIGYEGELETTKLIENN